MGVNPVPNLPQPSSIKSPGASKHLKLLDNDYFSADDKHVSHLRNLTQKIPMSGIMGGLLEKKPQLKLTAGGKKSVGKKPSGPKAANPNSVSSPDFSEL
jgi:hypothetical protein